MKYIILKDKTHIKITDEQYKSVLKSQEDESKAFTINGEYIPFSSIFRITNEENYYKYYESKWI